MGQKTWVWKSLWCLWMIHVVTTQGRSVDQNPGEDSYQQTKENGHFESPINIFSVQESSQGDTPILQLNGQGFYRLFNIGVTKSSQRKGTQCSQSEVVDLGTPLQRLLQTDTFDKALIHTPDFLQPSHEYYFCTKQQESDVWTHQGVSVVPTDLDIQMSKQHNSEIGGRYAIF
jgi:hypothetical protein